MILADTGPAAALLPLTLPPLMPTLLLSAAAQVLARTSACVRPLFLFLPPTTVEAAPEGEQALHRLPAAALPFPVDAAWKTLDESN